MHVYLYIHVLIDTILIYIYTFILGGPYHPPCGVVTARKHSKHAGWLRVKASHGHDTFHFAM